MKRIKQETQLPHESYFLFGMVAPANPEFCACGPFSHWIEARNWQISRKLSNTMIAPFYCLSIFDFKDYLTDRIEYLELKFKEQ